jgi:hypothetical protein
MVPDRRGIVQTVLFGAVHSHVPAQPIFSYKWGAAGGGECWLECSSEPPEGHPVQLVYTFVICILSMSRTPKFQHSLSAVNQGISLVDLPPSLQLCRPRPLIPSTARLAKDSYWFLLHIAPLPFSLVPSITPRGGKEVLFGNQREWDGKGRYFARRDKYIILEISRLRQETSTKCYFHEFHPCPCDKVDSGIGMPMVHVLESGRHEVRL